MTSIKIATWNLDGLSPNVEEVEVLLHSHNIDILLVSESHLTDNNNNNNNNNFISNLQFTLAVPIHYEIMVIKRKLHKSLNNYN